jgi:hypothetical protein
VNEWYRVRPLAVKHTGFSSLMILDDPRLKKARASSRHNTNRNRTKQR